jgi:hypothetical protein
MTPYRPSNYYPFNVLLIMEITKSYLETKEKRIAEGTAVRNMGGKKKSSTRVNSDVKKPKV